jgi:hypothetical protein
MKWSCYIAIALVLCLSLAGGTQAASAPPKAVCLGFNSSIGGEWIVSMVINPVGKLKLSAGSQKIYAIHGEMSLFNAISFPVVGTGHISVDNRLGLEPRPWFHFSLTGTYSFVEGNGVTRTFFVEGYWDLTNTSVPLGKIKYRTLTDVVEDDGWSDLVLKDCSLESIPY